ncbi:MAG: RNA polymerase sigma factor [Deltaproteobacteria bacterium]|nr:MAG: RNA polymerase sigma factor [Deltaproteobacteria bacterium]
MADGNAMQAGVRKLSASEAGDDELMARVAGGDGDAFTDIVRRYQRPALQIAYRMVGCPDAAQDVVQNAFLKIFCKARAYRTRGRFRAFFYRVVLNEARMKLRARKRRRNMHERLAGERTQEVHVPSPEPGVWEAVGRLRAKHKVVIVLRYTGDLSTEEIAEILRIPAGTVKSRLFAALRKLRRMLEVA